MHTFFRLLILTFFSGIAISPFQAWADEVSSPEVVVSCIPQSQIERSIVLKAGEKIVFNCSVANPTSEQHTVMVLGKQYTEGGEMIASSVQVTAASDVAVDAVLSFPEPYTPGKYRFQFSVINVNSKEEVLLPIQWSGELKGSEAVEMLNEVSLDRAEYAWGDPIALTVGVSGWSEKSQTKIAFSLEDETGEVCQELLSASLSGEKSTYQVTLPSNNKYCSNTLRTALLRDGVLVDKKVIALGLPSRDATSSALSGSLSSNYWQKMLWLGVVFFSVIGVLVVVYKKFQKQ